MLTLSLNRSSPCDGLWFDLVSWLGELSDLGSAPLAVDVYWESYPGKKAHIWRLWEQTGWLQVACVSLETPVSSHEETLTYFCNDMGQRIPAWLGNRLFDMRCSVPSYMHHEPPEELENLADALYWDFLGRCDRKNLADLEQGEDKLIEDIHSIEKKGLEGVSQIDDYISSLRREKRHPECSPTRKLEIDSRITEVEKYKPQLLAALPTEIEALRKNYERLEEDTFESLTYHGRIDVLYTVRWTMCSRRQPTSVNLSLWTEERFRGNLNVGSAWKAQTSSRRQSKKRMRKAPPIDFSSLAEQRPVLTLKESKTDNKPSGVEIPRVERAPDNSTWAHKTRKKRKREIRQELSAALRNHGTLSELKYVRTLLKDKRGEELKAALIHLAKHDFMSTDDAVYLFKVLTALNAKKNS